VARCLLHLLRRLQATRRWRPEVSLADSVGSSHKPFTQNSETLNLKHPKPCTLNPKP